MLQKDTLAAIIATLYLIAYCAFLQSESTQQYAFMMLLFSPLVLCGLVFIVLKYGKYDGRELGENEYGYHDKANEDLNTF